MVELVPVESGWPRVDGARVDCCPRCGKPGYVRVERFRNAAGRYYYYWVARHSDGRRCMLGRASEEEARLADERIEGGRRLQPRSRPQPLQPGDLDRAAWYVVKASYALAAHRLNPTPESLHHALSSLSQALQRLGAEDVAQVLEEVRSAGEALLSSRDPQSLQAYNMAYKRALLSILSAGLKAPIREPPIEAVLERLEALESRLAEVEHQKLSPKEHTIVEAYRSGKAVERRATVHDKRRAKVYLPRDWAGKKVLAVRVE